MSGSQDLRDATNDVHDPYEASGIDDPSNPEGYSDAEESSESAVSSQPTGETRVRLATEPESSGEKNDNEEGRAFPGFGLSAYWMPSVHFRIGVLDWQGDPVTVLEIAMVEFMNQITDKPDWQRKVFDTEIVNKWREEAVRQLDFNETTFDACVEELRHKVTEEKEKGYIRAIDLDVVVVKSDTIISDKLKESLQETCARLEQAIGDSKDFHPFSDDKVVNLVHPSLFPLIYGVSRVLTNDRVGLKDCVSYTGSGTVVKPPGSHPVHFKWYSQQFQWLPCDVALHEGGGVSITSYINNLHPARHEDLYHVLEQFIDHSIPLWDETLTWIDADHHPRVPMDGAEYAFPLGEDRPKGWTGRSTENDQEGTEQNSESNDNSRSDDESEYTQDSIDLDYRWERETRVLIHPSPTEYEKRRKFEETNVERVNLRHKFLQSGIQVIVKLANIELTPDKPRYDGGTWHIEGQLNEHICAVALYYYDSENISESFLSFRHQINEEDILMMAPQDDYSGMEELYGVKQGESTVKEIGKVLTREGRLLAFPNVLQHRVSPFELVDKSKPGHRKILALFLVDPHIRILSTAKVPPQRKDWWAESVIHHNKCLDALPPELSQTVLSYVDFPLSMEDAKEYREELIIERRAIDEDVNGEITGNEFSFCEH